MAYGEVHIDPAVADAGLASWGAASSDLQSRVSSLVGQITSAHGADPWGGDSAGGDFKSNYLGNADVVADAMPPVADRLVQLGADAQTAIQASLASDETQAQQVTVPVESGL